MRTFKKIRPLLLLFATSLVLMVVPATAMAAQLPVNLGDTFSYAVLAGSTITNTGHTTISGDAGGDVGLYPGTSFPGQAEVTLSGTVHLADADAREAKDALVTAYDDAAGRTPVTQIPSELGGTTLTPGVYASADGTFQITGTLTLNAQDDPEGVFVFQTASTLITASNSNVNLINGARYCRTFWQVGSSATLGTNSHFVGHIFAMISITANTGATVQGQLLARTGAVTLDTNTITNGFCATPTTTSTTTTSSTTSTTTESPTSTTTPGSSTSTTTAASPTTTTATSPTTTTAASPTTTTAASPTTTTTASPTTTTTASATTGRRASPMTGTTVSPTTSTTAQTSTTSTTSTSSASTTSTTASSSLFSSPPTTTITGGQLPKTDTPWYNVLLLGSILALFGVVGSVGYWRTSRKTHG